MTIVIIDLRSVTAELGIHFDKSLIHTYTSYCTCGNEVRQTEDKCPRCGASIVWKHSPTWEDIYGSPRLAIEELRRVVPGSVSGATLCRLMGEKGFRSKQDDAIWSKAERLKGVARMEEIARFVASKHQGTSGMAHAVAIARKIVAQGKEPKPTQTNSGGVASWNE